jgi:hypothetical protein
MDMGNGQGEQPPPFNLRGWLSDVYFPALIDGALGQLGKRLGPRAKLDDPILGRAVGLGPIESHLGRCADWLRSLGARYERGQFTTGVDRDVTEGTLLVTQGGRARELPVAVVAERRRSREVEVRIYYAASAIGAERTLRAELSAREPSLTLPALVGEHMAALQRGDVNAALACFEENGVARDANGVAYGKANGTLATFHEKRGGWHTVLSGYADDGRTCVLEHTLVRVAGKDVMPEPALMAYERGDSGLFRALRVYDEPERGKNDGK